MIELGPWEFRYIPRRMYVSPELCTLLELHPRPDCSLAEVLARWKPMDRLAFAAALEDAIRRGRRLEFEGRLVGPIGLETWLRLVGEPVFERGECVGLRGAADDITELRMGLARRAGGARR